MSKVVFSKAVKLRILGRIGALVRDEAKRKCAVDKGILRNSIEYEIRGDSVYIYTKVKYGPFVEWGTGLFHLGPDGEPVPHLGWYVRKEEVIKYIGMRAQPFLRPALLESEPRIKEIIKEALS